MRCFVSIEFPENIRAHIFHCFEKLKESGLCSGSFVDKDNLHLTLTFLGELSEEEIEVARSVLSKIQFQRFPIETGEIGLFPNQDYVRVVWVNVISKEISFLRDKIQEALIKEGFKIKDIDFDPHLTVARIKNVKNKDRFMKILKDIRVPKNFFIAEDFSLMKSILKEDGPEYKVIDRFGMLIRA